MLILMTQTEIQKISLSVSLSLYISLITMNYSGSVLIRFLTDPLSRKSFTLVKFFKSLTPCLMNSLERKINQHIEK